jgi:DNA repair protein RadA/Sms
VRDLGVRLAEAGRMGFRAAAVPAESPQTVGRSRVMDGLRVVDVDNVARALELLGMVEDDLRREAP